MGFSRLRLNRGASFLEAVLAVMIFLFFVVGCFWAFLSSKKVERQTETLIQATSVAGSVLETMKGFLGTDNYYDAEFSADVPDLTVVGEFSEIDLSIGNITPSAQSYQVDTYEDNSRRTKKDGFKKVTVSLEYTDAADDITSYANVP